ncbi:MAG: cell wall hydrolase [Novosphingobium sp.]|nr:cell wall hydrolase [Novosphingobium sp.]
MSTSFNLQHEPRPGDFSVRIKRSRQRSIASRRRRRVHGRSTLALPGAVALPAFAQPAGWDRFQIGDAGTPDIAVQPMPFEQAGNSFPGSAFYYLAVESETPGFGEGIHSDADSAEPSKHPGTAARPTFVDNSGINRSRAEQCLAAAIYYEAASESDSGQRAVAQVVLNRVAHPSYPGSICGVVYQGSERRTGCQFSFTCDGSLARKPGRLVLENAQNIARQALSGYVHAAVGLATHYHTVQIYPYWAPSLSFLGRIGAHRFYSFKGAAGRLGTFSFAYGGAEPQPVRHSRVAAVETAESLYDPLAIQRAFEDEPQPGTSKIAQASTKPAPAPIYAQDLEQRGGESLFRGDKLPEATGIKPEYRNSGQWIVKPTS